jgi:predicted dinucleotide-binding enzyme
VAESDILLLASPWPATEEMIRSAGDLSGKVLIDATNPFKPDLSGMTSDIVTSGGELVASWAKGAKVVKAFNSIGFPIMDNPAFGDARAVLLYCGDDGQAKAQVHQLAADLGFQPQDLGPLSLSAALEYTALTWVTLAFKQGFGPQFAFQLLRR